MLFRLAVLRAVGDPQGDDLDARGDAQVVGIVGADQAGDGRAVLRGGRHRVAGAVGEIVAGDDLVAGAEAAAQGRIVVVDAGVDDGDGHAGAVDVVSRASGGGADDRVVGGRRADLDRSGRPLERRRLSPRCVPRSWPVPLARAMPLRERWPDQCVPAVERGKAHVVRSG